ncbi:E3 ubiquitin-protein ligase TRIM21-like [Engraulis encrasicolus]|uniref:E3 ubiquitin-protein ligase TRIM21-like n=1 Tax=Engraulis encrasicolus TaxID=184585 RepID=UPI002FD55D94
MIRRHGVNITLDPATAHPLLILSADGKQVVCAESQQSVSPSKDRFDTELCVLAQESISHGRNYYEVLLQGSREWIIGLMPEHIDRSGPLDRTADLYLALQLHDGSCYASEHGGTPVQLREDIQRVGVFVDYEEGDVSFYDVEDSCIVLLYSFTGYYFPDALFPIFSPGRGDEDHSVPLVILPVWEVEFRPLLTYEVKSDKIKVENFLTAKLSTNADVAALHV